MIRLSRSKIRFVIFQMNKAVVIAWDGMTTRRIVKVGDLRIFPLVSSSTSSLLDMKGLTNYCPIETLPTTTGCRLSKVETLASARSQAGSRLIRMVFGRLVSITLRRILNSKP